MTSPGETRLDHFVLLVPDAGQDADLQAELRAAHVQHGFRLLLERQVLLRCRVVKRVQPLLALAQGVLRLLLRADVHVRAQHAGHRAVRAAQRETGWKGHAPAPRPSAGKSTPPPRAPRRPCAAVHRLGQRGRSFRAADQFSEGPPQRVFQPVQPRPGPVPLHDAAVAVAADAGDGQALKQFLEAARRFRQQGVRLGQHSARLPPPPAAVPSAPPRHARDRRSPPAVPGLRRRVPHYEPAPRRCVGARPVPQCGPGQARSQQQA